MKINEIKLNDKVLAANADSHGNVEFVRCRVVGCFPVWDMGYAFILESSRGGFTRMASELWKDEEDLKNSIASLIVE